MENEIKSFIKALIALTNSLTELLAAQSSVGNVADEEEDVKPAKKAPKKKSKIEDEDFIEDTDGGEDEETESESESDDDDSGDEESKREELIDTIKTFIGKNQKGEREKVLKLMKKNFGEVNVQKLNAKHLGKAIKLFSK